MTTWLQQLSIGDCVDLYDPQWKIWCYGCIGEVKLNEDGTSLKIKYIGWPSKYEHLY